MSKDELKQFLESWIEEKKESSDLAKMCDGLIADLVDDLYPEIDRMNGIVRFKKDIIKDYKKKEQKWFDLKCKMRMLIDE